MLCCEYAVYRLWKIQYKKLSTQLCNNNNINKYN